MLRELPDDLMSKMGYRLAYGEAARLAEMATFDHGWGRDFAAGVGGEADAIEREVMRRISHSIHPEVSYPRLGGLDPDGSILRSAASQPSDEKNGGDQR
jgi:hypothetical protein